MRPAHPIVRDVMTRDVVTIEPDTPFKRIAEVLVQYDISAVPVVDRDGYPVGVVSEADLLHKEEYPAGARTAPLRERLLHQVAMTKVDARVAGELMTMLPVAIGPDASLAAAARRLLHERVKRLLVLDDDGRLVGIVSRGDVLRAFVRTDEAIRIEVHEGVIGRELCMDPLRFGTGSSRSPARSNGATRSRSSASGSGPWKAWSASTRG